MCGQVVVHERSGVCGGDIKGKKLSVWGRAARPNAGTLIECERTGIVIVDCIVFMAVVVVIAIFIYLQQPLDILIAGLAGVLDIGIKQIGQGFTAISGIEIFV